MKINLKTTKKDELDRLNGCLIIARYQEDEEKFLYFLCSSSETDFYLMAINDSFTLDAEGDFNIDVSECERDIDIINTIFDEQAYSLVEIIPSNQLELRRNL